MTGQMLLRLQPCREHQTVRIDPARRGLFAQVRLRIAAVLQQPKHAALDRAQKPHPDIEYRWGDLIVVVEAAKHEPFIWQSSLAPGRRALRGCPPGVVDLVAIR